MSHARRAPQRQTPFALTLLANGGAELTRSGVQVWASDSDDEFADQFGQEFLDENDGEAVFEYLVEAGYLTDEEADAADFFVESQERVPDSEEDEDEDEDDAEWDEEEDEEEEVSHGHRR